VVARPSCRCAEWHGFHGAYVGGRDAARELRGQPRRRHITLGCGEYAKFDLPSRSMIGCSRRDRWRTPRSAGGDRGPHDERASTLIASQVLPPTSWHGRDWPSPASPMTICDRSDFHRAPIGSTLNGPTMSRSRDATRTEGQVVPPCGTNARGPCRRMEIATRTRFPPRLRTAPERRPQRPTGGTRMDGPTTTDRTQDKMLGLAWGGILNNARPSIRSMSDRACRNP